MHVGKPVERSGFERRRARTLRVSAILAIWALVMLGACSEEPAGEPTSPNPSPSPASETTSASALQLVVIGDSIALGETCFGCTTYPEQLAEAMAESLERSTISP